MAVVSDCFPGAIGCACGAYPSHVHKSEAIPELDVDLSGQRDLPGFDRVRSVGSRTSRVAEFAIPDRHENPR